MNIPPAVVIGTEAQGTDSFSPAAFCEKGIISKLTTRK
jgi:hypothetical protein